MYTVIFYYLTREWNCPLFFSVKIFILRFVLLNQSLLSLFFVNPCLSFCNFIVIWVVCLFSKLQFMITLFCIFKLWFQQLISFQISYSILKKNNNKKTTVNNDWSIFQFWACSFLINITFYVLQIVSGTFTHKKCVTRDIYIHNDVGPTDILDSYLTIWWVEQLRAKYLLRDCDTTLII